MSTVTETQRGIGSTAGGGKVCLGEAQGAPLSEEPAPCTGINRGYQLPTFAWSNGMGTVLGVWSPDLSSWLGSRHVTLRQGFSTSALSTFGVTSFCTVGVLLCITG